ncbi:twin-arginine translocase subunit TatB [Brevundimonas sp. S30B]|nr:MULTISPECIES: Sec-independent protein translocase protein TatB [unclassified Brevundimonas]QBX37399.1 twin-arginine translocase subunit TatB [Brevundimonas sp. MF30-B]TFW03808.1 twin-arginine translocase subunit TatB [Brevundimonas sp. S30B]
MGGLGPGISGLEILVIGLLALLVVGPKDLPVLMRRVGKVMGKARAMANDFRASFDEMARQSELDELRKEVEALRTGQGMHPLGADAEEAFRAIRQDLDAPAASSSAHPVLTGPEEWPDMPVSEVAPEPPPDVSEPVTKPEPKATVKTRTAQPKARKSATRFKKVDP